MMINAATKSIKAKQAAATLSSKSTCLPRRFPCLICILLLLTSIHSAATPQPCLDGDPCARPEAMAGAAAAVHDPSCSSPKPAALLQGQPGTAHSRGQGSLENTNPHTATKTLLPPATTKAEQRMSEHVPRKPSPAPGDAMLDTLLVMNALGLGLWCTHTHR